MVIPSYNARSTILGCLRSLERQTYSRLEIVVADSSEDGTDALVAGNCPGVRLVRAPSRMYPGEARNLGARRSQGQIVAFLDADCRVEADWAERLVTAHQRRGPVVGGAVATRGDLGLVAWAAYFSRCSRWAPEVAPGPMADLPGCSLSIERSVLNQGARFPPGTYSEDTALSWALRQGGHSLWFEPAVRVYHDYSPTLPGLLATQWQRGRAFARVRREHSAMGPKARLGRALACPLVGPLLFVRMAARVCRYRIQMRRFLMCSPVALLSQVAWAAGEGLGYLA